MKEIWVGFSVALLLVEIVALPASAMPATTFESGETQSTLIELFTSEGCSSCPPAEKWMSALKSNQDLWKTIIPVAFHVDYWDRLGWRDCFAKPEFTSRQQRYAAAWGGEEGECIPREWAISVVDPNLADADSFGADTSIFLDDAGRPRIFYARGPVNIDGWRMKSAIQRSGAWGHPNVAGGSRLG